MKSSCKSSKKTYHDFKKDVIEDMIDCLFEESEKIFQQADAGEMPNDSTTRGLMLLLISNATIIQMLEELDGNEEDGQEQENNKE